MYRVIFQNSRREEREIGIASDIEHANKIIKDFLDEHNFVSYYTRSWMENGRMCLDVGSWTEFFYLEEINIKEIVDGIVEKDPEFYDYLKQFVE